MKFELICVDMFQTLVNVNSRVLYIWKRILGEEYSEERAHECAKAVSKHVINGFHEGVSNRTEFVNLKTMFKPFFQTVLEEMKVSFHDEEAVRIFMDEHTKAAPYDDVKGFFSSLRDTIPICLVTDADFEMVEPIIKKYKFDEVFLSEKAMAYKNEPKGKIFREVLRHYSISPEKILHIGDSSSDIIGASRVGIKTCWINRENRTWNFSPQPDYIIESLNEVKDILDLGQSKLACSKTVCR
jgi:HAD superfamily hydrolase (TIGR01549 family)